VEKEQANKSFANYDAISNPTSYQASSRDKQQALHAHQTPSSAALRADSSTVKKSAIVVAGV
jgi:hypothetical protein